MNLLLKSLMPFTAAILLSSCVSHGKISEIDIADPDKTATAVVIRENQVHGAAVNYIVTFDGIEFYGIGTGESVEFQIPEGEHAIGVRCPGPQLMNGNQVTFPVKKDEFYYFSIRVIPTGFPCAKIQQISDVLAEKLSQTTRRQK